MGGWSRDGNGLVSRWKMKKKCTLRKPKNVTTEDVRKEMPLVLDQPLETTLLGHHQETLTITVSSVGKQVTTPETAHVVVVKDKPKRTLSISMKNTTTMKGLKPRTVSTISNNSLTLCSLTKKQSLQRKWESQRIFPQLD